MQQTLFFQHHVSFSEQAKKDDFARSIAARGIAQNIATNAILTQGMAEATRNLGTEQQNKLVKL